MLGLKCIYILANPVCFVRRYSRNMCVGGGERERLPSFTESHQGGKNQTSPTEEEGWKGEKKKRQKRGEEGERWKQRWGKTNVGKKAETRKEKKAKRGVGREQREGRRWALAEVSTLWSFLPTLSPIGQRSTVLFNS